MTEASSDTTPSAPPLPAEPAAQPPATAPSSSGSGSHQFTNSLESARNSLAQLQATTSQAADTLIQATSHTVAAGISLGLQQYWEVKAIACQLVKEGKGVVDDGLKQLKVAEDAAIGAAKATLVTVNTVPTYVSYPALGVAALLALPMTRRGLYNMTIGKLRSPDSIKAASTERVKGLTSKLEEVSTESQKLAERMQAAEEEMRRGMSALKETRLAMQRLASVASKSEKAAAAVLDDLRRIKKLDNTSALRAEAASQLAAFKSHYGQLQKNIRRIASQDI